VGKQARRGPTDGKILFYASVPDSRPVPAPGCRIARM
jgi:hypothetical protein